MIARGSVACVVAALLLACGDKGPAATPDSAAPAATRATSSEPATSEPMDTAAPEPDDAAAAEPMDTAAPEPGDAAAPTPAAADPTPPSPRGATVAGGATLDELAAARASWKPELPPDKIEVTAAPGVNVMSEAKQNQVVVSGAELKFKAADHPDVLAWEAGKVIVSAPADKGSRGKNPFGFARRVERVEQVGDELIVTTRAAALEEIIHGEFQVEVDLADGVEVEWDQIDLEWAANHLYVDAFASVDHYPDALRNDEPPPAAPTPPDDGGDPFCCRFVTDAASSVGGAVVNKVVAAGNIVASGAKTVGGAVADGAKAVGGAVADGAKAVGGAVADGARAVGSAANASTRAVVSVSQGIYEEARGLYEKIMPKSLTGEASLEPEFSTDPLDLQIVDYTFEKAINERGKFPMQAKLSADGSLKGVVKFTPKLSIGAEIPNPLAIGPIPPLRVWTDISAVLDGTLTFELALEASIASAGGAAGSELERKLGEVSDFAGSVLNDFRKELLGNEDTRPAGSWKRTIYLSKPKTKVILLGKVPVVIVGTFQVDIDCGFEMKAQLNATATLQSVHTFTYRAEYNAALGVVPNKPTYNHTPRHEISVLGGGEASVSCGVTPRINVFLYDAVGIFAGVRGSGVVRAKYESTCDSTSTRPNGEVSLSLNANVGIPVGARVQAPGSSYAGKDGLAAGVDIGPFEVWNKEWTLYEGKWDVPGLGYCTATCDNGRKGDGEPETDVDCGGACPAGCAADQNCGVNSDCGAGLFCVDGACTTSHCGDGVISGSETGLDCGGPLCAPCGLGAACRSGGDCASKDCAAQTIRVMGRTIRLPVGKCAADLCADGVRSPGECGVDCGGECPACAVGALCGDGAQCASGQSNRYQCVASTCANLARDGAETGLDCGGATSCDRCGAGESCKEASDCAAPAPVCTPTGVCAPMACGDGRRVTSAIYGIEGKTADVTTRVNELAANKATRFNVRNEVLGIDPAYGFEKTITVSYYSDGCELVTKTAKERSVFEF